MSKISKNVSVFMVIRDKIHFRVLLLHSLVLVLREHIHQCIPKVGSEGSTAPPPPQHNCKKNISVNIF